MPEDPLAEAFERLAHDIRLRIVRELANDRRVAWQWRGRQFAALRKAVGVRDAGQFSYHLDELQPEFVVKDGERYYLTPAGMEVAGAVLAGTYSGENPSWREPVDYDCPTCGEPLAAVYRHSYFRLSCPNHGTMTGTTLPPGVVAGRTPEEVVANAVHDVADSVARALNGECPHCGGPTDVTLPSPDQPPDPEGAPDPTPEAEALLVRFDCERCGLVFWTTPGDCIARHPAVSGFCWEHGVDTRTTPRQALTFTDTEAATLESEDPVRVRVDVTMENETLRVTLDEDAAVVNADREC